MSKILSSASVCIRLKQRRKHVYFKTTRMKSKTPYSLHVQEYVRFAMTDTVRYHPALPSLTAGDQVTADQLPHNKTFMVHVQ